MALINSNAPITEQNLSDFYQGILPYLAGGAPNNLNSNLGILTNPNHIVTEARLSEFYEGIKPYLNRSKKIIYGMRILRDESNPSEKIIYLADAVGMTPAYMDYENDVFNYGSWENAFFMPRPCMLKYDGTVDYYLDPNDYTKKEDGTASDVANTSYEGNAMMEWPKIWLKIVPDATKDNKQADIFISNTKIDNNYTDWNYHDSNGNSVDHFYTTIYSVSNIGNVMRSLSGQNVYRDQTSSTEKVEAEANNPSGSSVIWTNGTIADRDLILFLMMLIGKSTDLKTIFGSGITRSDIETCSGFVTGSQNDRGLFHGTILGSWTSSDYSNTIKVFGMENYWGIYARRYLGEIMVNNVRKRKLTYGTEDGSSTTGYNLTGDGYIEEPNSGITGDDGLYIKEMMFSKNGMYPVVLSSDASSSTYYCNILYYYTNGNIRIPMCNDTGGFCNNLRWPENWRYYSISSTLSARPLASL